jgi:signal transduction histidine kinase
VFREWTVVGVLTVVSVSVAVGLAVLASRRLVQPLHALTAIAGRLGAGDTRPVGRRFGVPEIDRVAQVLGTSAQQIGDQLRREREFASDASHQLRTPLTALTIRLEEIALAAEEPQTVRSESQAALAQVERLTATVDALLARARGSRIENATHIDVERLLSEQVREYEPAYRHAGRSLTLGARPGLRALGTPGGIAQAVATLLDNALTHGAGTVTVGARPAADHVVVEIGDEGPGVDEALLPHIFERSVSGTAGTGLGLALARALVEADGGRLELVRARPATFAIFLPVAPAAPAADHPEPAASSPSELVV